MSIAGNIDDGKEPVATAGILHHHIVEVDKVSIGAADQQQPVYLGSTVVRTAREGWGNR